MAVPLFNIGGLASGLDTNSIISSVLDVERIPIQQLEARRDADEAAVKAAAAAIEMAKASLESFLVVLCEIPIREDL